MRKGFAAIAVATAVLVAGCADRPGSARQERTGHITVGATTHSVQSTECTQIQWMLTIDMVAGPGRAEALLRLGGEEPIAQTVSISGVDGFNGVVGGELGDADVTVEGATYTITGTAVGSRGAVQKRPTPFELEVTC